jgi:dienelactone hydrolase
VFAASIPGKGFTGFLMEIIGRRWTIPYCLGRTSGSCPRSANPGAPLVATNSPAQSHHPWGEAVPAGSAARARTARTCRTRANVYQGADHGFHNDTTPRYDEAAAKEAWERTLGWFNKYLR